MSQPAVDDALIGFVLADKYRIVRQIGRGGMGVVYEAQHIQLGKRVAIKLMLEKYQDDTEAIARFQREAVAASRIGNPHIIDVSDVGVGHDGRSFVVMELLNGLPLSQVREMTGPMPPWRAVSIMRQVLRAVGAAHAKGIIHRDLKPDNIFLIGQDDQHDFVKLLDFGISKVLDLDEQIAFTKLTHTGVVMGTPLYMAPEQAQGLPVGAGADIYACGAILYELLSGRPPFEGQTYAVLVAKLLTAEPDHLASLRPGLPLALVNAVHRALAKEPQDRFATAELFAASLPGERTPSQIELAGTLDSGLAIARMPKPAGSKKQWFAIGGALLVGVATAGVLIATQTGTKAPQKPATPTQITATPLPEQPPPVLTGTLEVKTTPAHAQVTVDDNAATASSSPLLVTLAVGTHKVHVELAGFTAFDTEVEIRASSTASLIVPLAVEAIAAKKPPNVGRPAGPSGRKDPPIDLSALGKTPASIKADGPKTVKHPPSLPATDADAVPPKIVKTPPTQGSGQPSGTKPNPY
ncbi:MAG: protein kinase [Kofleriaceae bacterium]